MTEALTLTIPEDLERGTTLELTVGSPLHVDKVLGHPLARRLHTAEDVDSVIRVLSDLRSAHRLTISGDKHSLQGYSIQMMPGRVR